MLVISHENRRTKGLTEQIRVEKKRKKTWNAVRWVHQERQAEVGGIKKGKPRSFHRTKEGATYFRTVTVGNSVDSPIGRKKVAGEPQGKKRSIILNRSGNFQRLWRFVGG